ncbi:hypothetical protein QBC40DRAFT_277497 [Triangularia verruculosa]|uniref:t-SNARE coiled-coil homology domain-containing protein n=1 Tax=Triangularia verruculosa TaxID=2587418 RepID=A0AAN6XLF7_9PEZI|nr:hypothetical protein QBC40DRAFT_277497 [Triangularia verruculosa]
MDPSLVKEMQLELPSPRGSDSSDTIDTSDNVKSGRNPKYEAKMEVDQSQRRRPPLNLGQSQGLRDPEKLSGEQFSESSGSSQDLKKTSIWTEGKGRKRDKFWRWISACFIGDDDLTDDEYDFTDDEYEHEHKHKDEMEPPMAEKRPIMGKFSSLFRSKSDKDKAGETNENPYAQQPSNDTYSNAPIYGAAREAPSGLPPGPRPGGFGGLPSGPRPGSAAPPPYSAQNDAAFADNKKKYDSATSSPSIGYGNDRYGNQAGYGSNRYDNAGSYGQNNDVQAQPQRQGGYGGLNEPNPLFEGRQQRDFQDHHRETQPDPNKKAWEEMTEDERQEEEIQGTMQEANRLRGGTEDILDRMLGKIEYTKQQAGLAMDSIQRQGEVVYNTKKLVNEASVQARIGKANAEDLENANKSMLNFYAMSRKKRDGLDDARLVAELEEKEERQRVQREAAAAKKRRDQRAIAPGFGASASSSKPNFSKYIFEDNLDGDQAAAEQRIDEKTERAIEGLQFVKAQMQAFSAEVDDQMVVLKDVEEQTSKVHDSVLVTHNHIKRI